MAVISSASDACNCKLNDSCWIVTQRLGSNRTKLNAEACEAKKEQCARDQQRLDDLVEQLKGPVLGLGGHVPQGWTAHATKRRASISRPTSQQGHSPWRSSVNKLGPPQPTASIARLASFRS